MPSDIDPPVHTRLNTLLRRYSPVRLPPNGPARLGKQSSPRQLIGYARPTILATPTLIVPRMGRCEQERGDA